MRLVCVAFVVLLLSDRCCGGVRGDIVNGENNVANQTVLPSADDDADAGERPSEVQKAVCTVTAGEVRASAEAVTTKTLKGVCSSADLRLLETKLFRELADIKALLLLLQQQKQPQQVAHAQYGKNNLITVQHVTAQSATTTTTTTTSTSTTAAPPLTVSPVVGKKHTPKLKSLPNMGEKIRSTSQPPASPQREQEVNKFNNTLLADRELKIFTYYWKLENFSQHLHDDGESTVESPIFAIKGKTLHIRAHFHHLRRELLYLQLEEAQLNSSNRHNIILDTGVRATTSGGLFKEIITQKISFKHKISILDQQQKHGQDLVSQELNKLEMGFLIPHSALLASPYVKDNALLIQIFLYL